MSTPTLVTLSILVGTAFASMAVLIGVRLGQEASGRRPRLPRQEDLLAAGASPAVAAYLAQGYKILAIKAYREETGAGLYEAKAAVDQMVSRIRAIELVAAGASERVASLLAGGDTIGAVKAYRAETGLGLRDAKEWVDALLHA